MGKHFLGDYKPVNVYRNNVKLAGWTATEKTGEAISYTDTYNDKFNSLIADGAEPQSLADWHGASGALSQVQTVQGKNYIKPFNDFAVVTDAVSAPADAISLDDTTIHKGIAASGYYGRNVYINSTKANEIVFTSPPANYGIGFVISNLEIGTTYTISADISLSDSTAAKVVSANIYNSNRIFVRTELVKSTDSGRISKSFTLVSGENTSIIVVVSADKSNTTVTLTNLQLELGSIATAYAPFVPNSPSPDYPSAVTPNILAGSYKIARPAGGWWELTLTDDMRGISTYTDKVNLDLISGKGKLRKRISKKVFDGTETGWAKSGDYTTVTRFYLSILSAYGNNTENVCLSSHFTSYAFADMNADDNSISINASPRVYLKVANSATGIASTDDNTVRVVKLKAWLAAEYAAGTPVTMYYVLATETVTDLTLTHTDTSDLPELTLADLGITVSSLDYPFTIYESNNNFISISNATEVKQTVSLPTLRAIGTVKDRYDILSGVKTKKISEWITIPQSTSYAQCLNSYSAFKRINITQLWDYNYSPSNPVYAVKYDGKRLSNQAPYLYTDCIAGAASDTGTRISVSNIDSGWSVALTPSAAEINAYFLGWQMCHDDGTAPYLSGTKNWKHITDGTGLTATLPTATYAGYTPYRLLYQLATPAEEQLATQEVPTYPWHTDITQTGDALTTITANAKVMD